MPQMAPYNWLMLNIYMSLMMMIYIIMLNYIYMNMNSNIISKKMIYIYKFKW